MKHAAFLLILISLVGCSPSDNKGDKTSAPTIFDYTPEDEAFAENHHATWIPTNFPPGQFTVDFQDGFFSKGSTLACNFMVADVQRDTNGLLLTGTVMAYSIQGIDIEAEITTNMLASIRTAGGKLATVRLAFKVDSFREIESQNPDDFDRHLIRGKAVALEPFKATGTERKSN